LKRELTPVPRSPSEHLNFLLNAHVKSFAELGIEDPNGDDEEGEAEEEYGETDPLLGPSQSGGSEQERGCFVWLRWCLYSLF
jgi:hypothetical protein